MEELREEINNVDEQIMELLMVRLHLVNKIGVFKKKNNIPILDEEREKCIYDKINDGYLLDEHRNFITSVYREIISKSKEYQNEL